MYGDLRNLLLKCQETSLSFTLAEKLRVCSQIASGMVYLGHKKFVHRDLAARNILLGPQVTVKISDFGMSRYLIEEDDAYMDSEDAELPTSWLALESMTDFRFTMKSDVWSYGIVMFEVFSNAQAPYGLMHHALIPVQVQEGLRPRQPDSCPDAVFSIMQTCWLADEEERPNFKSLLLQMMDVLQKERQQPDYVQRDIEDFVSKVLKPSTQYQKLEALRPNASPASKYLVNGQAYTMVHKALAVEPKTVPGQSSPYHKLGGFSRPGENPLKAPNSSDYESLSGYERLSDLPTKQLPPSTRNPPEPPLASLGQREDVQYQNDTVLRTAVQYQNESMITDPYDKLPPKQEEGDNPYESLALHTSFTEQEEQERQTLTSFGINERVEWYFGKLSRTLAERALLSQGKLSTLDGVYLVREGSSKGTFALSVVFDGKVFHYKILPKEGSFYFYGQKFPSLEKLIEALYVRKIRMPKLLQRACRRFS